MQSGVAPVFPLNVSCALASREDVVSLADGPVSPILTLLSLVFSLLKKLVDIFILLQPHVPNFLWRKCLLKCDPKTKLSAGEEFT